MIIVMHISSAVMCPAATCRPSDTHHCPTHTGRQAVTLINIAPRLSSHPRTPGERERQQHAHTRPHLLLQYGAENCAEAGEGEPRGLQRSNAAMARSLTPRLDTPASHTLTALTCIMARSKSLAARPLRLDASETGSAVYPSQGCFSVGKQPKEAHGWVGKVYLSMDASMRLWHLFRSGSTNLMHADGGGLAHITNLLNYPIWCRNQLSSVGPIDPVLRIGATPKLNTNTVDMKYYRIQYMPPPSPSVWPDTTAVISVATRNAFPTTYTTKSTPELQSFIITAPSPRRPFAFALSCTITMSWVLGQQHNK